ncbi:MAG: hypothetical protein RQ872_06850 [Sulfolobaceae archaeon]|nr:hypothetical protein [Sulfolobaceae archaeon]
MRLVIASKSDNKLLTDCIGLSNIRGKGCKGKGVAPLHNPL